MPGRSLVEELEDAIALHLWEADRVSQRSLGVSQGGEGRIVGSGGTGGQDLKYYLHGFSLHLGSDIRDLKGALLNNRLITKSRPPRSRGSSWT